MMEKKYVSIDTLVGKQVIDSNATIVGNIKEITFDTYLKTIALNVKYKKGKTITIEDNNITTIGDVVLLNLEQPPTAVLTVPSPPKPRKVRNTHRLGLEHHF